MTEREGLLPCPFCGGGGVIEDGHGDVSCHDRTCPGYMIVAQPKAWNRRAAPAGFVMVPVELLEKASRIYDLMLRCSTSCPPMRHLLTTDGLYGFHMADLKIVDGKAALHVRNDGKQYVMEADWADDCGKLVKALKAMLAAAPGGERD